MKPNRVVHEHYELDAWTDPWGKPIDGHVVEDYVDLIPTGESHPYHNGYSDETGLIYATPDGDTCYAESPIDYCGSTRYIWLTGRRADDKVRPYVRPSKVLRYVFDGAPVRWDPDANDFLLCELDTGSQSD